MNLVVHTETQQGVGEVVVVTVLERRLDACIEPEFKAKVTELWER